MDVDHPGARREGDEEGASGELRFPWLAKAPEILVHLDVRLAVVPLAQRVAACFQRDGQRASDGLRQGSRPGNSFASSQRRCEQANHQHRNPPAIHRVLLYV
jgi:hypothetical protein